MCVCVWMCVCLVFVYRHKLLPPQWPSTHTTSCGLRCHQWALLLYELGSTSYGCWLWDLHTQCDPSHTHKYTLSDWMLVVEKGTAQSVVLLSRCVALWFRTESGGRKRLNSYEVISLYLSHSPHPLSLSLAQPAGNQAAGPSSSSSPASELSHSTVLWVVNRSEMSTHLVQETFRHWWLPHLVSCRTFSFFFFLFFSGFPGCA